MRVILGFIRKEFSQSLRDPKMIVLLFVAPIIQITIFGLAISTEVKNIRLAVYSNPHDEIASRIEQHALASGWFLRSSPDGQKLLNTPPEEMIEKRIAEVVLVTPSDGVRKSFSDYNKTSKIQLLIDATNLTRARGIENYINSILQNVFREEGLLGSDPYYPLYSINPRVLYNPSLESPVFLVPAIITMLINLVTILLTSMSLAKEKEMGTIETIISTPLTKTEIIVGKTLPYLILASLNFPLVLLVSHFGFHVPIRGSLVWLALTTGVYLFVTVSIGIFISTISKTQQQAMMGGFIFLFPAVLLSGAFFPVENLPIWIKPIAYINPQTYYLASLRNLLLKGGSIELLIPYLFIMLTMGVFIFYLSIHRLKEQLN